MGKEATMFCKQLANLITNKLFHNPNMDEVQTPLLSSAISSDVHLWVYVLTSQCTKPYYGAGRG